MLNDNPMIEGTSGEVHITDFTANVIENLLFFMYNDSVDKKNITCDLLKAANKVPSMCLPNYFSHQIYLSALSLLLMVRNCYQTNLLVHTLYG